MLTFAAAVFFLVITPGPGVLSTAGVGSAFGTRAGVAYLAGLFIGFNAICIAVVSGLAALLLADPRIRLILFALSFGYLSYLALRIALAGSRIAFIERAKAPGVSGGIILQIMNPKAYAVTTALFTGFSFVPGNYGVEVMFKIVIMNLIWVPIHLLWLWAGVSLHRLDLSERSHTAINTAMALSMMVVVALVVVAQLAG